MARFVAQPGLASTGTTRTRHRRALIAAAASRSAIRDVAAARTPAAVGGADMAIAAPRLSGIEDGIGASRTG